jgi:ubiquinone/menaquinone biosynthesis C-methylase UbiE
MTNSYLSSPKKLDSVKTLIRRYWDWRSKSFGHDTDKSVVIADKWESTIQRLVMDAPGRCALDIGTGTGQFAVYLARSGFDVTGIDISPGMISQARQYAKDQALEIDFQIGDAEHLGFRDHRFDVVVSRNLLWTLPHPGIALKEWRRVMKPGGILVVSDGFWMNHTLKRIHMLAFNLLRRGIRKGGMVSIRFFCNYVRIQRALPFYEGLHLENANRLLKQADFRNIRCTDTSCFGLNPYAGKNRLKTKTPSFFILQARR